MAVLLMTEPSGARLPLGKQTVLVRPRPQQFAETRAAFGLFPPGEDVAQRNAGGGEDVEIE